MVAAIEKKNYRLEFDTVSGEITGIFDYRNPLANWIAEADDKKFGTVFLHGTQDREDELPFAKVTETEKGFFCTSATGATCVNYDMEDDRIHIDMKTCKDCGPRMGLQLNLNFLDMPTKETWQYQCMPKVIYTDEACEYAYFVFGTADGRVLGITVDGEFAAWRIKYSYDGHKMTGFQILSQADDVKCTEGERLPDADRLSVTVFFADNSISCLEKIAEHLGISIAYPEVSGGPVGGRIPLKWLNEQAQAEQAAVALGDNLAIDMKTAEYVLLERPGIYTIRTVGKNGRLHSSRILCHKNWKEMYDEVNHFYREHFQDECGAFYRAVRKDSLKPEGITFEGVTFGNPQKHFSCRTGEFGGFAAWAMMKNCMIFGKNPVLMESAGRYILNWALNRGHEDTPYIGTVCKKPAEYAGRSYSAYHLFEELNYVQHEAFLLEELVDYARLTGDESVLEDATALAEHIISDHLENGVIINENTPGHRVDYTTVHSAVSCFIALGKFLKEKRQAKFNKMYQAAEEIADHVCRRALNFPTEGEPCTEDGSISCSAITLLRAYMEIKPKAEYLKVAEDILQAHRVLELNGADCRMKNSSLRFWETQYESHDWGPSINAGHGWTIWYAEAKALYAKITGDFNAFKDSYEGFITNICKIEANGGMSVCYTPDMIPGTPHAYYVTDTEVELSVNDERQTSVYRGQSYVPGTYSTSGNFFLIRAADIFAYMSGLDSETKTAVNGVYNEGVFISAAPKFDYLLLKGIPECLTVKVEKGHVITLAVGGEAENIRVESAEVLERREKELVVQALENEIRIRR